MILGFTDWSPQREQGRLRLQKPPLLALRAPIQTDNILVWSALLFLTI